MKGKRLLASMLALLLVVSLLPVAAMADDLPNNPVNETVETVASGDTMATNNGQVGTYQEVTNTETGVMTREPVADKGNFGTITTNGTTGTVTINQKGATVGTNENDVIFNYGAVNTNNDLVTHNEGTVGTNNIGGTVTNNIDTVENNNAGATVEYNYGLVGKDENGNLITNGSSGNFGTVEHNKEGGVVAYNRGEVETNEAGGVVAYNRGMVEKNESGGIVQYNDGGVERNFGTVENNSGTVFNEGGTVAINNPGGYVYYGDKESVTTNYGTHEFWDSDTSSSSPVCFHGVHFVNDKDEMVYLGDYEGSTDVKLEQLQKNCTGYKIYGILAVEDYNRDAKNFIQRGSEANESNSIPSFTIKSPTRLTLLWEKIASVFKPASNEPEAKPVKAAALPSTVAAEDVKVGTVVRVKGQLFRVIEMDDASMTVVTMGKLSGKDMEDLMAFLAKYFTPEQIELLLGDPELISGALAEELFGGNTGHIVFKAARNLFA